MNGISGTTDANGKVTLSEFESGTYTFTITHAAYETFTDDIIIDADMTVDVSLTPKNDPIHTLTVKTTDKNGNLGNVVVAISGPVSSTGTSDASGDLQFANVKNGTYTITATKSGYEDYSNLIAVAGDTTYTVIMKAVNQNPSFTYLGNQYVNEGRSITFVVSASDPDGDALTFSLANLPADASFNQQTGVFSFTAGYDVATDEIGYRDFPLTFTVSDGRGGSDTLSLTLRVVDVPVGPTANTGGPYVGIVDKAITLDASGSTCNGCTLTEYYWDFGDGQASGWITSPTVDHTYSNINIYTATLTVKADNDDMDSASTAVSVLPVPFDPINRTDPFSVWRWLAVNRVDLLTGEFYNPGETLKLGIALKNTGDADIENLRMTVSIDKLADFVRVGPFDLDEGDSVYKTVVMEIPDWAEEDVYDIKLTFSSNEGGVRRVKGRDFFVVTE